VVDHAPRSACRPADALTGDRRRLTAPPPSPAHRRSGLSPPPTPA